MRLAERSASFATSWRPRPEEFVCWFVMRKAPPLPFLPPEWHGKEILVLAMCYSGADLNEGERIAAPLRQFGKPIADVVGPQPYTAWQSILDPLLTPGARNYWKSHDFTEVSDGLIDVLIAAAKTLPDPSSEIAFAQLGGAVNRVSNDATAYSHRDGQFVLNVHGRWDDAAKDAACIGWARDLFDGRGAILDRRGVRQLPHPGRGRPGARRLRQELRSPGRDQEPVRSRGICSGSTRTSGRWRSCERRRQGR